MSKKFIYPETIITSHANPDYDALASMVAAKKLYPNATLIFPGNQEKNIRDFFIQTATYLYGFQNLKDIKTSKVKVLVLTDVRQASRISHLGNLLDQKNLEIHVYDHHPATEEDLKASFSDIRPWGSTTAIIVDILRKKNIPINADEATLLGVGIYEDTGSLTFGSTTAEDIEGAAWLKRQGMDLNLISDLLNRELSSTQITIISKLIEAAVTHEINGEEITFTEVSTEEYVGDFALLVHKFMDLENVKVLFAIGRMKERIQIVARSRSHAVDVGRICASLGGGGHPFAASAALKDKTLPQVKESILALLYSHINSEILVDRLMSRPAISIVENRPISEAVEIMTRFGLKAMPVVMLAPTLNPGVLERDIADRALSHGLGEVPVGEYMIGNAICVTPDAGLYQLMEIILGPGKGQRLVPVLGKGKDIIGVVTRTDLVNAIMRDEGRIPENINADRRKPRNIINLLNERLPIKIIDILREAGRLALSMGFQVYAVGGFVRDILLGQPNLDLDLVVEGDGIAFAEALAAKKGGRCKFHRKFQTAIVILPDEQRIDVATARLEYYPAPAALPTVQLSSLKMDLYRRDFTINALAMHLNPSSFGDLEDYFGSQKDIKDRVLRVLHSLSLIEDPTRILRAVRFEQRLGFRIDSQMERLIKNAVQLKIFKNLSGSRIMHEFRHILEEKQPLQCIKRLQQFRIFQAIHPSLNLTAARESVLIALEKVLEWYKMLYLDTQPQVWYVYIMGLSSKLDDLKVEEIADRLSFSKKQKEELQRIRSAIKISFGQLASWAYNKGKPSELYFIFEQIPIEGILYIMAKSPKDSVKKYISAYITKLRDIKIDVTGADLQEMGIPSGPRYNEILRAILTAKVDGKAESRQEQLLIARSMAAEPATTIQNKKDARFRRLPF